MKHYWWTPVILASMLLPATLMIVTQEYGTANVIYVGGSGAGNYTTIQEAIDAAQSGDIIHIAAGIYMEHVVVTKDLHIIGEGANKTIIAGTGSGDTIYVTNCSIEIRDIGVCGTGTEEVDAGIKLQNTYACIIDNVCVNTSYNGIYVLRSNTIMIESSTFSRNYYGIHLHSSSNCTISSNTIIDNYRHGILMEGSHHNDIEFNSIYRNLKKGISIRSSNENSICGNNISASETGIYVRMTRQNIITNNVIAGNRVGALLEECENNHVHHNSFIYNTFLNAKDTYATNNQWDDGSAGNYWSDYDGVDGDNDGIGDTPYEIPGEFSVDNYPIMNPTITDTIPPKIENIKAYPSIQELNGYTNITCVVTDNLQVRGVSLNITYPNGTYYIMNMTSTFGDIYSSIINCTMYGNYNYSITATDMFNNTNTSSIHQFSVSLLPELPTITNINAHPDPQEFPQPINISCNARDNAAMRAAYVVVKRNGILVGNYSMEAVNIDQNRNGIYAYYFAPPFLLTYSYYICVEDINHNWNKSSTYTFSTKDTTPPEIKNISVYPILQDVNKPINISCGIMDNHEVDSAGVNIFCPNGSVLNIQ